MKLREFSDKVFSFGARALSEDSGQPSSRRVVMVAAIFAAIFFSGGLLIKHPEMCVDLIKFVIINVGAIFFGTRVAEKAIDNRNSKVENPAPAAPAA